MCSGKRRSFELHKDFSFWQVTCPRFFIWTLQGSLLNLKFTEFTKKLDELIRILLNSSSFHVIFFTGKWVFQSLMKTSRKVFHRWNIFSQTSVSFEISYRSHRFPSISRVHSKKIQIKFSFEDFHFSTNFHYSRETSEWSFSVYDRKSFLETLALVLERFDF